MKKGKLLGKGMTAEVYEWENDKVLKLYSDRFSDEWIKREVELGKIIHEAGIPSPEVFEIVDIEGRKGVVFERIPGKTILKHIESEPWRISHYAKQMAKLQYKIHRYSAYRLKSQKEKFVFAIEKSYKILGDKTKRILNYMEKLPDGDSVCHGDLHYKNIMDSGHGLVVIDWTGAYRGNPHGDVARTCMTISSPNMPYAAFDFMGIPYRISKQLSYSAYLNEYVRLAKAKFEDIDAWILPIAAARLKENIPGEKNWLMDIINKRLKQYDI